MLAGPFLARQGLVVAVAMAAASLPARTWFAARLAAPIHDITTDLENPPRYVAVAKLRVPPANAVAYAGDAVARQQRAAYGDLRPLVVTAPPARVLAMAADTARASARVRRFLAFLAERAAGEPSRTPSR